MTDGNLPHETSFDEIKNSMNGIGRLVQYQMKKVEEATCGNDLSGRAWHASPGANASSLSAVESQPEITAQLLCKDVADAQTGNN